MSRKVWYDNEAIETEKVINIDLLGREHEAMRPTGNNYVRVWLEYWKSKKAAIVVLRWWDCRDGKEKRGSEVYERDERGKAEFIEIAVELFKRREAQHPCFRGKQ